MSTEPKKNFRRAKIYLVRTFQSRQMKTFNIFLTLIIITIYAFTGAVNSAAQKAEDSVFVRFKIKQPSGSAFRVTAGGFRHAGAPWYFSPVIVEVKGEQWSEWVDLSKWDWHGRLERSGGIAEWASMKLSVADASGEIVKGSVWEVQLADQPNQKGVIHNFTEKGSSDSIGYLVPFPLRKNASEFETGSQMTARHAKWAKEATGNKAVSLKNFEISTTLWGHYDPALARQELQTLKLMGFNVVGNVEPAMLRETQLQTYRQTWLYAPEPEAVSKQFTGSDLSAVVSADKKEKTPMFRHFLIADEVSGLDFRSVAKEKLDGWFRAYLKREGVTDSEIGQPTAKISYPADAMFEPVLPKDVPLARRKLLYYAAKFGQYWSARQLRQISDLIRTDAPKTITETILPSHGFFGNAWGPANIGMSYRMLDIFELGEQESVRRFSAEDWLGLNHMYGQYYTWSGGQTFGYYNAIMRSATKGKPLEVSGLITPSDDKYLRLKANSSLGQGAKAFFFWAYGPTFIGTENYWSDLRSEYDGIVKFNRTLAKAEDVLYPAKTVSDDAAILYSVSHDIWNTDNQAPFVEKRLLWHGLRHLQIQPDFLREEDVANGKLDKYKVLFIGDWCVSRNAAAAIDKWVKRGGVLYLSAGAATRDEFYEPYLPPFAKAVWTNDAWRTIVSEQHRYNERNDLPKLNPLTTVKVSLPNQNFTLPVIGSRIEMRQNNKPFAEFADGKTAGVNISYGRGRIIAAGFMPMLAYGQLAGFKPTTLEEKWQPEAREIIKIALDAAKISPVAASGVPVVETNLLTGTNGSALVLTNFTYQPIKMMTVDVKIADPVKQVVSVEGKEIEFEQFNGKIRLKLPLEWTDIILLKK